MLTLILAIRGSMLGYLIIETALHLRLNVVFVEDVLALLVPCYELRAVCFVLR